MRNMSFDLLSSELLRELRGQRTQVAFSRMLGYRANPVAKWESMRAFPTMEVFFRVVDARGRDPFKALSPFFARGWQHSTMQSEGHGFEGLAVDLVKEMTRSHSFTELAARTGLSRYAISRIASGTTAPRLPIFLQLVDVCTHRLLDFVACFVDPARLPSVAAAWATLQAAREAAYGEPYSQAVLRVLELEDYRALQAHVPGFIAKRLGTSEQREERCLEVLRKAGQATLEDGKWQVAATGVLDTRPDPERAERTRKYWAQYAIDQVGGHPHNVCGYSLFSVSRKDLERIREAQLRYLAEVREIVAQSEPEQSVVLANTLLTVLAP